MSRPPVRIFTWYIRFARVWQAINSKNWIFRVMHGQVMAFHTGAWRLYRLLQRY